MSDMKLKSKLILACDYHSIDISEFAIPLTADPVRTEHDLKNFLKTFAEKQEASQVAVQDMVTMSCSSDNPKFQKEHLTVRVGLGLYSKELESKLTGMALGEKRTLNVGKDCVTVSVEKIVRESLPELTDEFAKGCGISEIQTAEDVHTYCRYQQYDKLLEDPADNAFSYLAGTVIQNSTFALAPEEARIAESILYSTMNGHYLLAGKSIDTVTEDEFHGIFGISKQDMIDNLKKSAEYTLKSAVLGQAMVELRDQDYEAYLQKQATALQRPVEEVRRETNLTEYLINTYNEFYMDTVEQYVFRKLKEVGEWKHRSSQNF